MRNLLARLRHDDRGFSMVVTLAAMSMLLVSAAVSVNVVANDQPVGRADVDRKQAYVAAESGLQVYVRKLLDDNAYWTRCSVPADGVNNIWDKPSNWEQQNPATRPADPRTWRQLPDGSAQYTIETLPANGEPRCLEATSGRPSLPEDTRIDSETGTFRVRVTGQARAGGRPVGPKRSIIASFKRRSFLDYIYFTDVEVLDPATYDSQWGRGQDTINGAGLTASQWGEQYCSDYSYELRNGVARMNQRYNGRRLQSNQAITSPQGQCIEIQFAENDQILGPLHTNDAPYICGRPDFGRDPDDRIEVSAPMMSGLRGYRRACNGAEPYVNWDDEPVRYGNRGTWFHGEPLMILPESNRSLSAEAPPTYRFVGHTTIRLSNNMIYVTGRDANGTVRNDYGMPYPPDGVIWVGNASSGCTKGYQVAQPDDMASEVRPFRQGCGIAFVSGTYNTSLTIAAEDDIRIPNHIDRNGDALLGLIAENFIRVHHPVSPQSSCATNSGGSNASGWVRDMRIDAALLTLNHSFIVDNWACGSAMGRLSVNGAISQKYRGPVATGSGGSTNSGYVKQYEYDDRLRFRSPPKFLDPVAASWRIQTYQEQVPAT